MAESLLFTCNKCGFQVESWSDGNPYIQGSARKRFYYYHPAEESQLVEIGKKLYGRVLNSQEINIMRKERGSNAPDHICLSCGKIRKLNPRKDRMVCTSCKGKNFVETWELAGKKCMMCDGVFLDGIPHAIS